jgi:hypothetical protein
MGPSARSPVADAASGSGPLGLHATHVRPNKKHVNLLTLTLPPRAHDS